MCQYQICPLNATNMADAQLLNMHLCWKYANVHVTYEVDHIKDVAWIAAHEEENEVGDDNYDDDDDDDDDKDTGWRTMMMPQSRYI